jgi:peroxiredoxin
MIKNKTLRIGVYLAIFTASMWGGQWVMDQIAGNAQGKKAAQTMTMVDQPAPEFSLPDLNDTLRNSHEWDGKVVILNFWATWCPPCISETPMFVEMQEQYGAAGLQFVGIAIDSKDKVQDFVDTYGVNYPILIGEDDAITIARAYGNRYGALPYTVVIDRRGQINFTRRGEMTREMVENAISHLL